MENNPYKSPSIHDQPHGQRPIFQRKHLAHLASVGLICTASFVLAILIAPADPISVYLATAPIAILGATAYFVGVRVGRSHTSNL